MSIAYTWQFESLDVYLNYQTVTNAVESMHWRLTANDGIGHTAQAYGEAKAGPVDVENFIPFADLTLEVVQGWCETAIGSSTVDEIKVGLVAQIDSQITPTMAAMLPPWS